jgi:hypothetical protein
MSRDAGEGIARMVARHSGTTGKVEIREMNSGPDFTYLDAVESILGDLKGIRENVPA